VTTTTWRRNSASEYQLRCASSFRTSQRANERSLARSHFRTRVRVLIVFIDWYVLRSSPFPGSSDQVRHWGRSRNNQPTRRVHYRQRFATSNRSSSRYRRSCASLSLSLSLSLSFSLSLSLSVFFARTGREKESANPPPCLAYHVRSRRRCAVGHNCSLRMQALFSAFPPPSPLSLSLSLLRETYFLALRVPRIYAVLPALSPCPFHVLAPSRLRYAPETPRCISSIFKRHGPSAAGSASIYKASGAPVTLGRLPLAASSRPRSDSVLRAADPLPNR